jgi:hypothetical protein
MAPPWRGGEPGAWGAGLVVIASIVIIAGPGPLITAKRWDSQRWRSDEQPSRCRLIA